MMPGIQEAINAASVRSWEAVVLVIIMISMLGFFGLLGRWFISSTNERLKESANREERLSNRIGVLETFVENTLIKLVGDCSRLMSENIESSRALREALIGRPCLLDSMR